MVPSSVAVHPECEKSVEISVNAVGSRTQSVFVDGKGNIKFVNAIVRSPVPTFCSVLGLCLIITIALFNIVFSQGMPFTPDDHTYDLYDARSRAYDSLRLARENVTMAFRVANAEEKSGGAAGGDDEDPVRIQENLGDLTYWIFEAKMDEGLFTEGGINHIRSVEEKFFQDSKYAEYCLLEYSMNGDEEVSQCRRPTSVTNVFYASKWNSTLAKEVIAELTNENIQLFNSLAACVQKNVLCDFVPAGTTYEDKAFVRKMGIKILTMMMHWDGEGELNQDVDEVSTVMASLSELYAMAPFVNFYFDGNFTMANPVAAYSRSIIYWGSPLDGTQSDGSNARESSRSMLKQ
jgi:hypothetical protein